MIKISIARFEELLAAERDATVLKNLILRKDKQYQQISYSEISLLKEVFFPDNMEVKA